MNVSKSLLAAEQKMIDAGLPLTGSLNTFYISIMTASGCSVDEAKKVYEVYKKLKLIIKAFDGSSIRAKDGRCYDKDVILRAIAH